MMGSCDEWLGQRRNAAAAADKHVLEKAESESIGKTDARLV